MDPERWTAARALFDRAVALPEAERAAFVEANAGHDPELRAELLSLLGALADAGGFLAGTHVGALSAADALETAEVARERVGQWRIVGTLGRGGMGVVYLGERAAGDFEKRVAIKVVSGGAENAAIVQRFRTERRILAALEHPAIARLLDGGTTDDGLPYFVMEYVEGETLLESADARRLDLRARIELFLEVCAAVEHAHQRLVLHRDLKPSNILVGADGRPKLLDFGIGKLLVAEGGEGRDATSTLERWMTPSYASPEQILGAPTTTATDVHGLGVVLFELLTGARPFRRRATQGSASGIEAAQESPRRASTAAAERSEPLAGGSAGEATAAPEERAARRGTTPARLRRQLAGDLDRVVGKAIEPDPARRFASVAELAADLRRYLGGKPVLARATSPLERLRKFVLRHRAASIAVAGGTVLLVALTAYHTATLQRERNVARREAANATEIATFLTGLFQGANLVQSGGAVLSARDLLDRGEAKLAERSDLDPTVRARLLVTMSLARESLGDPKRAHELATRAAKLHEAAGSPAEDRVFSQLLDAKYRIDEGRSLDALPILERAATLAEANPEVSLKTRAKVELLLGNVYYFTGDEARAKAAYERHIELEKEIGSPARIGSALSNLGAVVSNMGDKAAARASFRESVSYFERSTEKVAYEIYLPLYNLAELDLNDGDAGAAEAGCRRGMAAYEKVFGAESSELVWGIACVAESERQRGQLELARQSIDRALLLSAKVFDPETADWSWPLQISGKIHLTAGNRAAAIADLEHALAIERNQDGDRSDWMRPIEAALAEARSGSPKSSEAAPRASNPPPGPD